MRYEIDEGGVTGRELDRTRAAKELQSRKGAITDFKVFCHDSTFKSMQRSYQGTAENRRVKYSNAGVRGDGES